MRARLDDIQLQVQEGDYRSLRQLCNQFVDDPDHLDHHLEVYVLARINNFAGALLKTVNALDDIKQFRKKVALWCQKVLPQVEARFGLRIVDSPGRRRRRPNSPGGCLVVPMLQAKLAERIAYWNAEACSRVRVLRTAEQAGLHAPFPPVAEHSDSRKRMAPQFPKRAAWLRERLAERECSKHDLSKYGGPEHRTTQKVLDGLRVQPDVLRKIAVGLQALPHRKGHQLPQVQEADIPSD